MRVQLTSDGTLIVIGELGLAVEVLASGSANPEELLGEMLATPSPKTP